MPKQFQLKIADPCHEDWDKMTTSEKGKFCGSCQKQVVDFTGMTDSQLAAFFKKPSTGSVCGRFFDDQLDRKITVPRKRLPWIKYFFQITLPLFLASCTGNRTKGKVLVETVQTDRTNNKVEKVVLGGIGMEPLEEVQITCDATMGVVISETYPDIDSCIAKIEVIEEEKIRPGVDSTGYGSKDSLLNKEQINGNELNAFSADIDSFNFKTGDTLTLIDSFWTAGLVGISHEDNTESEVLTVPDAEPVFKIYANPARANSTVFINAQKSEDGLYAIQLLNLSGQLIRQEQVSIGKGMGITRFSLPSIPSGNYLIVLLNKKTGKSSTEKLIVQ